MHNFYKTPISITSVPLVTRILREREALFDEHGWCMDNTPDEAKKIALGIMQVSNSPGLDKPASLQWLPHEGKYLRAPFKADHYVVVLSGQIFCMIGEEAPALNVGEVWWVNAKQEAILINKSGDDAVLLHVTVRTDE